MTYQQPELKPQQTIHQAVPAKRAGVLLGPVLTGLVGLLAAALVAAAPPAHAQAGLSKSVSARLQPGDIVYADSGDNLYGGFVIKVNPVAGQKSVLSSGGLLRLPFDVVFDAYGQIIVSDSGRLIRIDPNSGAQSLIVDNRSGLLGWPCGLAVDRRQSIVAANLQAVVRVNPNSGYVQTVAAGGSLLYPLGVAVAASGDLLVLNMAFPAQILRVSQNGAQTIISSGGLLNHPQAIAVSGDHIFVTDVADPGGNFGVGRVIDINAATGAQSLAAEGQYLVGPVGIAVDAAGQLVVGDPYTINPNSPDLFDGGLIRIDPVSHQQVLVTRGEGSFVNPRGVAIVPNTKN